MLLRTSKTWRQERCTQKATCGLSILFVSRRFQSGPKDSLDTLGSEDVLGTRESPGCLIIKLPSSVECSQLRTAFRFQAAPHFPAHVCFMLQTHSGGGGTLLFLHLKFFCSSPTGWVASGIPGAEGVMEEGEKMLCRKSHFTGTSLICVGFLGLLRI